MSILIFLIVLVALILVHELGHFIAAKRTGMRVDEFGIGFPPKLFGVRRGETEYTLNALPIGGFVRIYGESALAEDAPIPATDTRAFIHRPKWMQAIVLVAGVAANILFAWFLFTLALSVGTHEVVAEREASDAAMLTVLEVLPDGPAADAGIPVGATIQSVTVGAMTIETSSPDTFSSAVQRGDGSTVMLTYATPDGVVHETSLVPRAGVIGDAPDQPALGLGTGLVETVARPIHQALIEGLTMTKDTLIAIVVGVGGLIAGAVTGTADFSQIAGPVGIVGLVGDASAIGLTTLLMFTAFISLNLAVINLLPVPALDGGRLLFVLIEAVKGSPINPKFAYYTNAAGFILLMLLMVAVTYNDILRIT